MNRRPGLFVILGAVLICLFLADILTGSVNIPLDEALQILSGHPGENKAWNFILTNIRLPKAITAILAGSALSVSGLLMQTLFRNPLASPSELGLSAGAALGTGFLIFASGAVGSLANELQLLPIGSSWILALSASAGAGLIFSILLFISKFVRDQVVLLIVGLLLGTLTLSITSLWQYYSRPDQLQTFITWTFGSLGGVSSHQLIVLAVLSLTGIAASLLLSKPLNALLLGENYAANLGISFKRTRSLILITTCIMTGAVTAFCGPIGFVGIAVPHLARSIFNTSGHHTLIPATALIGAELLLVCDIFSQLPGNDMVLPINVTTSLIGAPLVIWIILRMNNLRHSF